MPLLPRIYVCCYGRALYNAVAAAEEREGEGGERGFWRVNGRVVGG